MVISLLIFSAIVFSFTLKILEKIEEDEEIFKEKINKIDSYINKEFENDGNFQFINISLIKKFQVEISKSLSYLLNFNSGK